MVTFRSNIVVGTSGPNRDNVVVRGISGPKTAWY